jgi:hypothetical protein
MTKRDLILKKKANGTWVDNQGIYNELRDKKKQEKKAKAKERSKVLKERALKRQLRKELESQAIESK